MTCTPLRYAVSALFPKAPGRIIIRKTAIVSLSGPDWKCAYLKPTKLNSEEKWTLVRIRF